MVQWLKHLLCNCGDQSLNSQNLRENIMSVWPPTCSANAQKMESGFLERQPAKPAVLPSTAFVWETRPPWRWRVIKENSCQPWATTSMYTHPHKWGGMGDPHQIQFPYNSWPTACLGNLSATVSHCVFFPWHICCSDPQVLLKSPPKQSETQVPFSVLSNNSQLSCSHIHMHTAHQTWE